jgi:hypothetical protein
VSRKAYTFWIVYDPFAPSFEDGLQAAFSDKASLVRWFLGTTDPTRGDWLYCRIPLKGGVPDKWGSLQEQSWYE